MRSQFKGHFGETQEATDELWKTATFVFDANVLLNLYRYSDKAANEFLKLLTAIQGRCWLPEQCVHEYLSNRSTVISDQMKAYSETAKNINAIKEKFAGSKGHPFISEHYFEALSSIIEKIDRELTRNRSLQEIRISSDELKEQIADIFTGKVGESFSDEDLDKLFVEGETRYSEKIPPGYIDGNKYPAAKKRSEKRSNFGDLILWRQIQNMAKNEAKPVILVTDDQKEDWWLISSGKTISPRPELISEFCKNTDQNIRIYTPNRFLQLAEEKLGEKVSEKTLNEIKQEHNTRLEAEAADEQARALHRDKIYSRNRQRALEMEREQREFEKRHLRDPRYQEYRRNNVADIDNDGSSVVPDQVKHQLDMIWQKRKETEDAIQHFRTIGNGSHLQELLRRRERLDDEEKSLLNHLDELAERGSRKR